jgi:hypothetical protein
VLAVGLGFALPLEGGGAASCGLAAAAALFLVGRVMVEKSKEMTCHTVTLAGGQLIG